ncbi:MAG: hypothetical protein ABJM30_03510, partial [Pseudophaeobacter sp.]
GTQALLGCRFWERGYFSTTNGAITEDIVLQYLQNHIQDPTRASRQLFGFCCARIHRVPNTQSAKRHHAYQE